MRGQEVGGPLLLLIVLVNNDVTRKSGRRKCTYELASVVVVARLLVSQCGDTAFLNVFL